ncbi:hypothetical protein M406DRAFT_98226 [Cryphonectria parasitica EP155]|uniref:MYB transcription factor n=1 Tax=Cryphonectria parasitica (strain ATCC 38755 / EP155) TaxID=660469 RepID=A0A9P4Y257_CRYP1|nr:uncharacterized protein M406DRAFT_98226 [Cryphonectria parasitica EP155]KAF3765119.1 hypothetical protein M406DRAFT_98226 [Cryphonectria parasitica EP155]
MATIEPRLMHLLNNTNASPEDSYYPPPDLPPIQSFSSFAKTSSSNNNNEKQPASKSEYNTGRYNHDGGGAGAGGTGGSVSGPSRQNLGGAISLRMLFDNPEINESSHSLNHILDDVPEPMSASSTTADDLSTKKRQRAMTVKDDIMHLPQPLKKQKSTQNISQNIMPPIINGLYEPPPNAAVFPPIALDDGNEGVAPASLHTLNQLSGNSASMPTNSVKRKAAKPRKKWSEEETKHLLLGVSKYGVGKWTSILDDPEYSFNGRTAGDLKDRFRTCCPDELRIGPSKTGHSSKEEPVLARSSSQTTIGQQESDSTAKPKKSRAHRKKIEDLQAMGIHGPFKKSHRRERRPFTQQDDDQILEGLQMYGPAWTKIQRDPRFDLSSRQPTDLRDRVRNKYPDMYKQIEEKQGHTKEPISGGPALPSRPAPSSRSNNVMEPTVNNMINENSLMTLEPHLRQAGSREEVTMPKWAGSLPPSASASTGMTGGNEQSASGAFVGMMDISRLLLDE